MLHSRVTRFYIYNITHNVYNRFSFGIGLILYVNIMKDWNALINLKSIEKERGENFLNILLNENYHISLFVRLIFYSNTEDRD